jgi:hypothetical protein
VPAGHEVGHLPLCKILEGPHDLQSRALVPQVKHSALHGLHYAASIKVPPGQYGIHWSSWRINGASHDKQEEAPWPLQDLHDGSHGSQP